MLVIVKTFTTSNIDCKAASGKLGNYNQEYEGAVSLSAHYISTYSFGLIG